MQWHEETLGEASVRWVEHGSGRPVVLVHGIPTSPRLWRRVQPLLRGRSLAWEMRGYGSSIPEGRLSDLSLAAQAGYLLAWLEQLRLGQPPVLVGHDLGGGVAQIAVARAPDRFSGLLLTNAVCYDFWPIPSVRIMQRLGQVLAHLPDALIYPTLESLIRRGHDDPEAARDAVATHWPPYARHGAAASLVRQTAALTADDTLAVADRLRGLELPARVVWGDADQFQKISYGERLAADLRTSLTRIRGGKHFTPEDHPEVIADAINALL